MYINGVRDCVEWNTNGVCIDESNWNACDTCNVEITVRMGKDDNYYEIRQPIPDTISTDYGWENIRINLDELTNKKTLRGGLETYFDVVDTYVFGETCLDIKCWGIQRIA